MSPEKYIITPGSFEKAARLLDERYPLGASREPNYAQFRAEDIYPALGFSLAYFADATQWMWSKLFLKSPDFAKQAFMLPSGWIVQSLDLGRVWERHLEFRSPHEPHEGYVIKATLDMVERELPGAKPKTWADIVAALNLDAQSEERRLLKENAVSDALRPEDSRRICQMNTYRFGPEWGDREDVHQQLASGKGISIWSHRPQVKKSLDPSYSQVMEQGDMLMASVTSRVSSADGVMESLVAMSEFLTVYNADSFEDAMTRHQDTDYYTLGEDEAEIIGIVRPSLSSPTFATRELPEVVDQIWGRALAISVMDHLDAIVGAFDAVDAELDRRFSHDDITFSTQNNGVAKTLFLDEDENTTAYVVSEERITIADVDPSTRAVNRVIVDFLVNGQAISHISAPRFSLSRDITRLNFDLGSIASLRDELCPDAEQGDGFGP
jgi:hypothetical protein